MDKNMIEYRLANSGDLRQVARIHKEQFPDHYLGQFSMNFLERFYKKMLESNNIFLVAVDDNTILGFVLGGEWEKISLTLCAFMKRNFVLSIMESSIRPKTWKKSIQKFFSLFYHQVTDQNNLDNKERFTLLSIATSRNAQGKGIGKGLIDSFNDEMLNISNRYYLSVKDKNEKAIRFYKKMGFFEAYRFPGEIQMIKLL